MKNHEKTLKLHMMFSDNDTEEEIINYINKNLEEINLNYKCEVYSNTFLILATNRKFSKLVSMLVELGVDVSAKNIYGRTALTSLISDGDVKNTQLLFDRGAKIEVNPQRKADFLSELVFYQKEDMTKLVVNHLAMSEDAIEKLLLFEKTIDNRMVEINCRYPLSEIKKFEEYSEKTKKDINTHLLYFKLNNDLKSQKEPILKKI